ncbi:MAG: aspartate-semialdehyde dehydrogenase [Candidatus Woesearchaeota archaeon]|jgi:aspartate-semialdehyde dehydrogenase|nr:aspartate-semialdehyde dehydrogenase [Candidatus Woesearchaeota archaeon]MDP7324041.1 aspartate-semialdehyde dehydrogenase [Candidatus Woesearchaeota archaeon]MDP7457586.1 aspartate-semialdehyde dehydrogenase [Candidatus Woesearchaeota archaeon]
MKKIKVGVLGATGMVGQRFVSLLDSHPWFEVVAVAASPSTAGKTYAEVAKDRWIIDESIPNSVGKLILKKVEDDMEEIANEVELVFSAFDLDKDSIQRIEEGYAALGVAVVSNNSAHRWTEDVPMIIPEVNPEHVKLIDSQRKNRGWKKGFIAVKPNCSIQSYVPVVKALEQFGVSKIEVTTLQALSGAGKTFETWPEMEDNVNPLIGGEECKSEDEPLKILGSVKNGKIVNASGIHISATCIRVPISHGHMASVALSLNKDISEKEFIDALNNFQNPIAELKLPSAPEPMIKYFSEEDRPQTRLDRDFADGMGITVGRLRKDPVLGWKFVALSHNTIRGAAGGAILVAELLKAKGYI